LYIDAAAHRDVEAWRASTVDPATDISATFLLVKAAFSMEDACRLQFSVLLTVAVRLATLRQFIAAWGTRDLGSLPLAWLRFQMDGGHVLFRVTVSAFKEALGRLGKTTVSGMSDMVDGLWNKVLNALGLPLETWCPVVIDEAQVLTSARARYSHVTDRAVRVPEQGFRPCACAARTALARTSLVLL
jgi:hypothetical protein